MRWIRRDSSVVYVNTRERRCTTLGNFLFHVFPFPLLFVHPGKSSASLAYKKRSIMSRPSLTYGQKEERWCGGGGRLLPLLIVWKMCLSQLFLLLLLLISFSYQGEYKETGARIQKENAGGTKLGPPLVTFFEWKWPFEPMRVWYRQKKKSGRWADRERRIVIVMCFAPFFLFFYFPSAVSNDQKKSSSGENASLGDYLIPLFCYADS